MKAGRLFAVGGGRIGTLLALALVLALGGGKAAWTDTFPGIGVGGIPDRESAGCGPDGGPALEITFDVSGLSAPVGDIDVAVQVTHPWVGDLVARLHPPTGFPHTLFGRTGVTTADGCGDSSDLGGTYLFDDSATGTNWWVEAADRLDAQILTPGEYRTTETGGAGSPDPRPATSLFFSFSGMPPAEANGTWTVRIRDHGHLLVGSVTAAALGINEDCNGPLGIGFHTVTGVEDWANCGELVISHVVVAAGGQLTLTSGTAVALAELAVEDGGTLTVGIDVGLNPLLLALEYSALLGRLDRLERSEASR